MPTRVPRVRWNCKQCNKFKWMVPAKAAIQKYCSNECKGVSRRVEKPVRLKQAAKPIYPARACEHCKENYVPATLHQRFCGMKCSGQSRKVRRIERTGSRECEVCKKEFTPRPDAAGRFCSWDCKNKGQQGSSGSAWKGGRSVKREGYVLVVAKGHPNASRDGYVLEHRLVMEKVVGRFLEAYETVHHINGDKQDNRPENLQLRTGKHGRGVVHQCKDCGSHNVTAVQL